MERFFLNLKMERVWQRDYANHAEAMVDIADYIVGFYNKRAPALEPGLSTASGLRTGTGNTTYRCVLN